MPKVIVNISRTILVLAILAAGAYVADYYLVTAKARPDMVPLEKLPTLVTVDKVEKSSTRVIVGSMGTVVPARKIDLSAQVSGEVLNVSPGFVAGKILREGEVILEIDNRNYDAAIAQIEATIAEANLNLLIEKSRKAVAEIEWQMFEHGNSTDVNKSLALREPYIEKLNSTLKAAEASLEVAKNNLKNTKLVSPFNSVVIDEQVEIGQVVGQQTKVASLVGTDEFYVEVLIPMRSLMMIELPDANGDGGSLAIITHKFEEDNMVEKSGRVVQLLSDLDPRSRMAKVRVKIDDPMGLKTAATPLLLNAYVKVEIQGKVIENVIVLPRQFVESGNQVWIMNDKNELENRQVKVIWGDMDNLYITEGLDSGDRVITSRISAPVIGMKLRTANNNQGEKQHGKQNGNR